MKNPVVIKSILGVDLYKSTKLSLKEALEQAVQSGADLSRANLSNANLSSANLSGADLSYANLSNANLISVIGLIIGPQRSDGYLFYLTVNEDKQFLIYAGCRRFTFPDAIKHWEKTRGGTPLGDETMAILTYLKKRSKAMRLK